MNDFWRTWSLPLAIAIGIPLGLIIAFFLRHEPTNDEPLSENPCIAAMDVSASAFEDYKELVELTSQNAVHAVEWDTGAMEKANRRINELAPSIESSFAQYEQLSEECKG